MTDTRLQKIVRVKHLRESMQGQAELQLANSVAALRDVEASVAEVEQRKREFQRAQVSLNAADLQNRGLYQNVLQAKLYQRQVELESAVAEVNEYRREVQNAYTETSRWATLEGLHAARVQQELKQRDQAQADELATARHVHKREDI